MIRSDEILNLGPWKNPAAQLRCDGTTVRSMAWAELLDSAVPERARTACSAALACAADGDRETGGGDRQIPHPLAARRQPASDVGFGPER